LIPGVAIPSDISTESYDAERRDFGLVLAAIDRMQRASEEELRSIAFLDEWVCSVGLGNLHPVEESYVDRAHLVNGSHQGIVQYPIEFARWLHLLGGHEVRSYLEIGCYNGATASLATAYLHRLNPNVRAVTVDLFPWFLFHDLVRERIPLEYAMRKTSFDFRGEVFDAVFIDGDHTFPWAWADYQNVGRAARICGLHDVMSRAYYENEEVGGVTAVWELIKQREGGPGIVFEEISDHPRELFGIGVRLRTGDARA
jgi:hypothetical protein